MLLTRVCIASLMGLVLILAVGCGGKKIPGSDGNALGVREIVFKADPYINQGQVLPVDIIYISYLERLREITTMGAEAWFNSSKRNAWPAKQSLLIKGGQTVTIATDPRLRETSAYLLIMAEYMDVISPHKQQVVMDSEANSREVIIVRPQSLEPENQELDELR